jgi:hypothetical protein
MPATTVPPPVVVQEENNLTLRLINNQPNDAAIKYGEKSKQELINTNRTCLKTETIKTAFHSLQHTPPPNAGVPFNPTTHILMAIITYPTNVDPRPPATVFHRGLHTKDPNADSVQAIIGNGLGHRDIKCRITPAEGAAHNVRIRAREFRVVTCRPICIELIHVFPAVRPQLEEEGEGEGGDETENIAQETPRNHEIVRIEEMDAQGIHDTILDRINIRFPRNSFIRRLVLPKLIVRMKEALAKMVFDELMNQMRNEGADLESQIAILSSVIEELQEQ